jgi:hypothetical protein
MAKRRKENDQVEEDKPFKMPKFDEEAFLKRERRNIKATFISFLFGCLMAFICFGFWALIGKNDIRWGLVFLVGGINAAFLKYIFLRVNIDLTDFGRKNWFGSYAIYFVTWLILFIVLVNPPFYDDEAPRIEVAVLPSMQELGGTVLIVAKITDNSDLEKQNIKFEMTYPDGSIDSPDFDFENHIFRYNHQSPNNLTEDEANYNFKITATDSSGHVTIKENTFTYSNNTITLPEPLHANTPPGPEVGFATTIKFYVNTAVNRVYYTVNDGIKINATKSDQENYYFTTPKISGWVDNKNVTVKVSAEVVYYFENYANVVNGTIVPFSNTITDTSSYYFSVDKDSNVGTEAQPKVTLPGPRYVLVPGFDTLIFLIALITVVLIFKYRKKDRSKHK